MSTPESSAPTDPVAEHLTLAVSGFTGREQDILRLRNANRESPETLAYLRWRYECAEDAPPPCIFWLLTPQGEAVGMAAAIFRPYWLNGARVHIAVIGDISLDSQWRGRGLGQRLLRFMTAYLDEHFPQHPALVIPTESARRALARVGWIAAGELAPLVLVLEPAHYLRRIGRSSILAAALGRPLRACLRAWVGRHVTGQGTLQISGTLEPSPQARWLRAAPAGAAERVASQELLAWRYLRHPHTRFRFATLRRAGAETGLLVFEDSRLTDTCTIYDLFYATDADLLELLSQFVRRCLSTPGLAAVRVLLDARHPARAQLRRVGLITRPSEAVFQVHSANAAPPPVTWHLSQGDKDV